MGRFSFAIALLSMMGGCTRSGADVTGAISGRPKSSESVATASPSELPQNASLASSVSGEGQGAGKAVKGEFQLVNCSGQTLYVDHRSSPVFCERPGGSGCAYLPGACFQYCKGIAPHSPCGMMCERPEPTMHAIAPKDTWEIPWPLLLYLRNEHHCSEGHCYDAQPIPPGEYGVMVVTYSSAMCNGKPCNASTSQELPGATPHGEPTRYRVQFRMPSSSGSVSIRLCEHGQTGG